MNKYIVSFSLLAILVISCTVNEMDYTKPNFYNEVFYAQFEDPDLNPSTKVYATEDLYIRWNADDRITIFNKYTYNQEYRFNGETGDNSGSFKRVDNGDFVTGNSLDNIYAIYPYLEATKISDTGVMTVMLPAEQQYAENTFGLGANTMVSATTDNQLLFKNVGGYLMLKLYGDDVTVSSITLKGNNGEKLSGKATVTMPVGAIPAIEMANDAGEEIKLVCDTPVTIGTSTETATTFWMVVPPTVFEKGFTLTVKDNEGGEFKKATSSSFTINRNNLARMSALKAVPTTPGAVTSVTLNKTELTLPVGKPEVLVATVLPEDALDKTVIWSTSDAAVASVDDNGKVTAIKIGNATITAKSGNKKATCAVTVTAPDENSPISFADNNTKKACVERFDTDGDGEISFKEAAAVVNIYGLFDNYRFIRSFDEFQYFTSVTYIPDKFFSRMALLESVVLPESIRTIGNYAFTECTNLKSFVVPNSVTSIGSRAFVKCTSLKSFVFEKNSKLPTLSGWTYYDIDGNSRDYSGIFGHCTSLTEIEIPASVTSLGYALFYDCSSLKTVIFEDGSKLTTIPGYDWNGVGGPFRACYALEKVVLPETITNIEFRAFQNCSALREINIPQSVVRIGDYAFVGCKKMEGVINLPKCQSIGAGAFSSCEAITGMQLSDNCTVIGQSAFSGCKSMETINLSFAQTRIESSTFQNCLSLKQIKLPQYLSFIGSYAFSGCETLTSIDIPSTVTTLSDRIFFGCTGLISVSIASSVETIGDYAFSGCSGMTTLQIEEGVETIGNYAFQNCTGLTSVSIPSSVQTLGSSAFSGCTGLTSVSIPSSVETIGSYVFSNCSGITSFVLPNGIKTIPNGIFSGCTGLSSISIPSSVETIGSSAFSGCTGLTSISIPSSVETIGSYAFGGCSGITSLQITEGVKAINERAFSNCTGLTSVSIPSSVETIGSSAFSGCSGITSLQIAEGVKAIDRSSFYNCFGLTELVIPSSIESIGQEAFRYCNSLKSIISWPTIPPSGGNNMFYSTNNCLIYVPSASVEAYKTATYWSSYANRIQAIQE